MLSEPLQLGKVDATKLIDFLYAFFHRDFVANKTYLNQLIYVDPRSNRLDAGKELDFWHLTSREIKRQVREGNRWVWISEGVFLILPVLNGLSGLNRFWKTTIMN